MKAYANVIRSVAVAAILGLPAASVLAEDAPAAPAPGAKAANARGYTSGPSFVEIFDALSDRRWYISDGWTNGAHQACTWSKRHVRIPSPGQLVLELTDMPYKDRPFSCAEIQTTARYGYGTYEVRMRPASASGLVTAFFTYNGPDGGNIETNDEIDFEFLGKDTRGVQLNHFTSGKGQHESIEPLDADASTKMNDYALEWLPDRLRWYVNGRLLRETVASEGKPIPSHPSKIMISLWSGQGESMEPWLGPAEYPGKPVSVSIERVAFTKLGDPCMFKESLVCRKEASERTSLGKSYR